MYTQTHLHFLDPKYPSKDSWIWKKSQQYTTRCNTNVYHNIHKIKAIHQNRRTHFYNVTI